MTTLIEIPSVNVVQYAPPSLDPLPLSSGDLSLTLLPPSATHPSEIVTLTVGTVSFPILPSTPVQTVQIVAGVPRQHASYTFAPEGSEGGGTVGRVRINIKESATDGEFQATQALCHAFEAALKLHNVFNEEVYHDSTTGINAHNWGQTAASAVVGAAASLATKLSSFTESNVTTTTPFSNRKPPVEAAASAYQANIKSAQFAETADQKVTQFGNYIHEGGKKIGNMLPDFIAKPASNPAPSQEEKGEFRKFAEEEWNQLTIAAKGLATAVTTIGSAVSESTHRAVEHSFGKDADRVAQDIGQAGSNIAGVGLSAVKATSVIIQGTNVATGVTEGVAGQPGSIANAQEANAALASGQQAQPGYHGKPVQVFSDEKQAELIQTAMK